MTTATMRFIEAVESLNMSGEIGEGMMASLHELAGLARLEQRPASVINADGRPCTICGRTPCPYAR